MEELEAIDWYQQRIDAAGDGELKEILRHNRDEEKEHAAMVLEVHRSLVMQDGGALFSMRGGDFIFTVGGDLAVGYRSHDRDALHLFCVETLAPQTLDPDAVCVLEGDRSST